MSYILDALRKSEYERQRNQAAGRDLLVAGHGGFNAGRRPWLTWVVTGMVVINLLSLGYFWLEKKAGQRSSPPPSGAATSKASEEKTPPWVVASRSAVRAEAPPVPAVPNGSSGAKPSTEAAEKPRAPEIVARPPLVQPAAVKDAKPAPRPSAVAAEKPKPALGAITPLKPGVSERALDENLAASAVVEAAVEKEEPLPLLQTMPPDFQAKIPAMKINLHAYFSDPSKRFVVINTNRYEAGAQLAEGLRLEEIRASGLVLNYEDTRFRINRP